MLLFKALPKCIVYESTAPALEVRGVRCFEGDRPSAVIESCRAAKEKSLQEGEQAAGSVVQFGTDIQNQS